MTEHKCESNLTHDSCAADAHAQETQFQRRIKLEIQIKKEMSVFLDSDDSLSGNGETCPTSLWLRVMNSKRFSRQGKEGTYG
jgi:hypothetical protein